MRTILAILMLSLAACGTDTGSSPSAAAPSVRLAPIRIEPTTGTCLWQFSERSETVDNAPIFGFSGNTAYMALNGTRTRLKRQNASKDLVAGLPRVQLFEADTMTAKLILRQTSSGSLKAALSLTRPSGWSTILPLEGAKTCR